MKTNLRLLKFNNEIVLFQIKGNDFKCKQREKTEIANSQNGQWTSMLKNLSRFNTKTERCISSVMFFVQKPKMKTCISSVKNQEIMLNSKTKDKHHVKLAKKARNEKIDFKCYS